MSIVFQYPHDTPTLTLTLRNPSFGDVRTVDDNYIIRRTRGGTLRTVKVTDWPRIQTLRYTFECIKNTGTDDFVDDLKTFLAASAAKKVKITTHTSDVIVGFIQSSDVDIITNRDICSYSFDLEILVNTYLDTLYYASFEDDDLWLLEDGDQLVYEAWEA